MSLSNCYHLRSDALLAMLIQLGFPAEAIDMDFNGDFRKRYTSGLESIAFEASAVHLVLNENSIYDQLPEGLFHQSRGNSANQSANSYIDEHKRYKREAKAARKFFNPLDQVLLLAKTDARLKKESVLLDLMADKKAFLSTLWGLEAYRNNKYLSDFLLLLHHSDRYKAQAHSIADCMANLLKCKVAFKRKDERVAERSVGKSEWILGLNTCLAGCESEGIVQWQFVFSEMKQEQIEDFFANGDVAQLLRLMERFFVPIDVLVNYEFEVPELQQIDRAILGITTL